MAKGRSSKAAAADTSKEATKKVSNVENATNLDENDGDWNMLRAVTADDNATTLCKNDGCGELAVAVWVNKNKLQDERPLCETCQEKEHGGWPNGAGSRRIDSIASKSNVLVESTKNATAETPTNIKQEEDTVMDVDIKEESTSTSTNVKMEDSAVQEEELDATSTTTTTSTDNDQVMEDGDGTQDKDQDASAPPSGSHDDEEEEWDLQKIIPAESITNKAIKCHTEECKLLACCIYVSSTKKEKWYSCIDCQDTVFGGWPPLEELPVKSLEKNHIQLLVDKCSKKKRPAMPTFEDDDDDSFSPMRDTAQGDKTNTITPLQQASKGSKVTPTPAKQDTKKNAKQNATMMKKHQEWQEAANKAGGGRIVVKKEQAKPLIFQMLYDKMKPMNITQIFTVRVLNRVCDFVCQQIF